MMEYEILTRSLKDSAAHSKLKLLKKGETFGVEKPGGEKRIHIGSITDEEKWDRFFFPNKEATVTVIVSKLDLIKYLLEAKDEYFHPQQSYRLDISKFYDELYAQILNIREETFKICFEKNTDRRYYICRPKDNPFSKNYQYISNICLPLVTNFVFLRVKDEASYIFYLKVEFNSNSNISDKERDLDVDIEGGALPKTDEPLQQIYYGAPGTGKSHEIKKQTAGKHVIRTTFHPDSDYSTFVGAYKPVMEEVDARVVPVVFNDSGFGFDKNNGTFKENRIVYKFVKQAFLKAYLGAWKKFANSQYNNTTTPPSSFNIPGAGYYTISGVEPKNIILSRIFDFSKKAVLDEWPNSWKNGTFEVPSGPQSGKSVQHAIAIWINKHIPSCTVDDFEKGWVKLISHIKELGTVDVVKKTQTYILSLSEDKEDLLSVTVEAAKKSRNNLLKIYEGKNTSYRLDNNLVSILKKYDDKSFKEAWDKLAKDVKSGTQVGKIDLPNDELEPQFLIIEEINRGNCAQIFGDLFQLLDRSENGYSIYPIEADSDIQDVIKKAFEDDDEYKLDFLDINGAIDDYTSNYGSNLSEDVKQGRVLLLPPNLYIWATMNTSDQSLFPIDSAFKRRWEWKYIKIKKGKDKNGNDLDWKIDVKMDENGALLSWWNFIEKINTIIASMTSSADKQLGFFFCQANADGIISAETFVSKVIFYLWNDVFKDYGFEDASLFRYTDKEGKEYDLTFPDFYDEDGEKVNTERLTDFLKKVMNWKKNNEESN